MEAQTRESLLDTPGLILQKHVRAASGLKIRNYNLRTDSSLPHPTPPPLPILIPSFLLSPPSASLFPSCSLPSNLSVFFPAASSSVLLSPGQGLRARVCVCVQWGWCTAKALSQ